MKQYNAKTMDEAELQALCKRPAIDFDAVIPIVRAIVDDVKTRGDVAVQTYEAKFGNIFNNWQVTQDEIETACKRVSAEVKRAFAQAANNIEQFHRAQLKPEKPVQTMPGVTCFAQMRGIERVGLYIPGGTAPLPSTVLMLAIPAKLAGCKEVVLCTPGQNGRVADSVLYAAKLCGVAKIFKIGGAQAIAAMAYGTESVPKVYKIFGPGNQYVTAAKQLVSIDPDGAVVDMPAGPSEVLVIADNSARADFVAADLLAQAEHGADSQVVLVCDSRTLIQKVMAEITNQMQTLPRKAIAKQALNNSFSLEVTNLDAALTFANYYAPEHLIINTKDPERLVSGVVNAGSVFIGPYACESAGDYASGTNHSLPTYGYARAYSGVSLASFQKRITFQVVTKDGAATIGPVVATMAATEGLDAHRRAMEMRFKKVEEIV